MLSLQPTPRGLAVILAGFLVALLPVVASPRLWPAWPVFLLWATLLFAIDAAQAARPRTIRLDVEAPDRLAIGETAASVLRVRARSRRAFDAEAAIDVSELLDPVPRGRLRVAGGAGRLALTLRARRRGTATVQAAWLRYRGPLGLVRRTLRRRIDLELPVLPDVQPVRDAALRYAISPEYRIGQRIERFRGEGSEFDSLDEFTRGDDPRALDWKHSARHRKLLARQFRAERDRQVVLAVDTGRLMAETLAGIPKLDHALNAALLLSWVCLRHGDRVGLFTFGGRAGRLFEPQAGMRTQLALTRLAADVGYAEEETNYTLGLTTLAQRVRRRSLVVTLTDFVDTVTAELLLENMGRLARRHLVVFVALRDPELRRVADATPANSPALHRAVIAQDMLRDREIVLRRLNRMGILTLDAEPRQVGTQLVNRYLEIKRRELL